MKYLIRKILTFITTLFVVSLLCFGAFSVVPGDPASLILGTEASPERIAVLREQLGLNKPLFSQYKDWVLNLFSGNCGQSIKYNMPVQNIIRDRLPVTLILSLMVIIIIILVSIPIGVYAAKKKDSLSGKFVNALTMINLSVPNFFLGIMFIWFFGMILKFFTPGGYISYADNFLEFLKFMIFPAIAIAIPHIATVVKFLKSSILNEMKKEYVRTAYSKGNTKNSVLYSHVLKNSLISVVTLLGMIIAEIFSGSIIMEQVYGIPGIGRLIISSIPARDFPVVETLVIYIAFVVVIINAIVDLVLQFINPQVSIK